MALSCLYLAGIIWAGNNLGQPSAFFATKVACSQRRPGRKQGLPIQRYLKQGGFETRRLQSLDCTDPMLTVR